MVRSSPLLVVFIVLTTAALMCQGQLGEPMFVPANRGFDEPPPFLGENGDGIPGPPPETAYNCNFLQNGKLIEVALGAAVKVGDRGACIECNSCTETGMQCIKHLKPCS